jgi:DNA-binding IclR family transcriptional regulator
MRILPHQRSATRVTEGAQSVRRAALLLRILASGNGLGLTDIGNASGLRLSTARRLLKVLMEEEMVEQDVESRRYSIGEELATFAMARPFRLPLLAKADTQLRKLAHEVGDATFLTVRRGFDSLCVGRYIGSYPIHVMTISVGARRPLGVSSASLALLSMLPSAKALEILQRNEKRFKMYDVDLKGAVKRLTQARELGYSINYRGIAAGTRTVSVPLSATQNTPLAALTVVALHKRLANNRIDEVVDLMRRATARIERTL